ncbi:MAG: sodium:proton antiporter [Ignavibacteriaceae bacterium]
MEKTNTKNIFFIVGFLLLFFLNTDLLPAEVRNNLTADTLKVASVLNANIIQRPPVFLIAPFIMLLIAIATGPLFYKHHWEKHYAKYSIVFAFVVAAYYTFFLNEFSGLLRVITEYISFIALLSSLFVASSGILINVDRKSTPIVNTVFLFIGAVLANFIGTTGASVLLIRPFIKLNKDRIAPYHIIFFIFIVSNVGGALTPLGDPPLFLGFLSGVPFFWIVQHIGYMWILALILILIPFYFFDLHNKKISDKQQYTGKIQIKGHKNIIYLFIIVLSVFIDPAIFPWVPDLSPLPFGIREIIMLAVVYFAYKTSDQKILKANEFNFEPIKEVAFLFVGIFITMLPALELVAVEAKALGNKLNADVFYWATGLLSSVLDNTPTYMNFLSAAMGKYFLDVAIKVHVQHFVSVDIIYLQAISISAVLFGAMTYIGNGPNFMVKSISERAGITLPSFFAYIFKYSLLILLPVYTIIWLLFFYGKG